MPARCLLLQDSASGRRFVKTYTAYGKQEGVAAVGVVELIWCGRTEPCAAANLTMVALRGSNSPFVESRTAD